VTSEKDGTGLEGAFKKVEDAGFSVKGTPYGVFMERYFGGTA
jgi:hypothetical protein